MKRIFLRNIRKYALVEDEDFDWASNHAWYGYKTPKDNFYYARATINNNTPEIDTIHLHRMVIEAQPGEAVTFKNKNRLDCRRNNLVIASRRAIRWDADDMKSNTTGYRGVTRSRHKFRAQIYRNGERYEIGTFATAEEASEAYQRYYKIFQATEGTQEISNNK